MKNTIIKLLVALLVVGGISSCKKYEEGPGISLRSKKERVANEWKITRFVVAGFDLTADVAGVTFKFDKEGDMSVTESGLVEAGKWSFNDDKDQIEFYYLTDPTEIYKFDIVKLKEKEMKWEGTLDGIFAEFTFEPK